MEQKRHSLYLIRKTMMAHRVKHNLGETLNDPKKLAEFREKVIPCGSGTLGLCRIIVELIERYADAQGWDLDSYIPEKERIQAGRSYQPDKKWQIYLADREYAKTVGDPCFGEVIANTKEEAEKEANRQELIARKGFYNGVGPWAVEVKKTK